MNVLRNLLPLTLFPFVLACTVVTETDGHRDDDDRWEHRHDGGWDDDNRDRDWDDDNGRDGRWYDDRDRDEPWDDHRDGRDDDRWDHGDDDDDRDGDRRGRDDDGDGTWTDGAVRYAVPGIAEMPDIQSLARTLTQRVEDLVRDFDQVHREPGAGETARKAAPLVAFRKAARDFLARLDANLTRPPRTVDAYRRLKAAHVAFDATGSRRDLGSRAERQMDRIRNIVDRIDHYYTRPARSQVDWNRVRQRANDVDERANRLYLLARRELAEPGKAPDAWRSRDVLERLKELRDAAAAFNAQAARGRPDPKLLRPYFDRLEAARRAAAARIGVLRHSTREEFGGLTAQIRDLEKLTFDAGRSAPPR